MALNLKQEPSTYESLDSDFEMSDEEFDPVVMVGDELQDLQVVEIFTDWISGPHIPVIYDDDFQAENNLTESSTELDFFEYFLSSDIMMKVAEQTNLFYEYTYNKTDPLSMEKKRQTPNSRTLKWKDVSVPELYLFFGLTMLMTRNKHLKIDEYWSSHPLLQCPIFGKTMPRDRYQILLQVLHFSDPYFTSEIDKLYKIRLMVHHTLQIFQELEAVEADSAYRGPLLALKWSNKRESRMLILYDSVVSPPKSDARASQPKAKPKSNKAMDTLVKSSIMINNLSCMKKSIKWYKKLCFHIIDLYLINAFSFYKRINGEKKRFSDFQLKIIEQIITKYGTPLRELPPTASTSSDPGRFLNTILSAHMPTVIPPTLKNDKPRRRCHVCGNSQTQERKIKLTRFVCNDCKVSLCNHPCFKIYHTLKQF